MNRENNRYISHLSLTFITRPHGSTIEHLIHLNIEYPRLLPEAPMNISPLRHSVEATTALRIREDDGICSRNPKNKQQALEQPLPLSPATVPDTSKVSCVPPQTQILSRAALGRSWTSHPRRILGDQRPVQSVLECCLFPWLLVLLTSSSTLIAAPKHPVVLAHGLLGFDEWRFAGPYFPSVQYWRGIKEALSARGVEVITATVPASGSIEARAEELARVIDVSAPGKDVNIIAYVRRL